MRTLSVLDCFAEFTGLRHCDISENSGEQFYHEKLNSAFKEALDSKEKLQLELDGVDGYASSFLDEALGNLVYDFTLKVVRENVIIVSNQEPHWKEMIEDETYSQWEQRRIQNKPPIVTKKHEPWFRMVKNDIVEKIWEMPSA